MKEYVVYFVTLDGVVVYIGSGVKGRENHCTSGVSHNYNLNKHHFAGDNISVEIKGSFSTKEKARQDEATLIRLMKPRYNVVGNKPLPENINKARIFQKVFEDYALCNIKGINKQKIRESARNIFKDIISLYGLDGLQDWEKSPKFLGVYKCSERHKHIFSITSRGFDEGTRKPHSLFPIFFEYKVVDNLVFIKMKDTIVKEMLKQYSVYKQSKIPLR